MARRGEETKEENARALERECSPENLTPSRPPSPSNLTTNTNPQPLTPDYVCCVCVCVCVCVCITRIVEVWLWKHCLNPKR